MKDLYVIAKEMEKVILETSEDKVVESPLLTKNQAEKLAQDYLCEYKPFFGPINPQIPNIGSYVVAIRGGKQNA